MSLPVCETGDTSPSFTISPLVLGADESGGVCVQCVEAVSVYRQQFRPGLSFPKVPSPVSRGVKVSISSIEFCHFIKKANHILQLQCIAWSPSRHTRKTPW